MAALAVLLTACGPRGPRAIAFGDEVCAHCHMPIADARYSAEAISVTGKTYVFDDVACLAAWLEESDTPPAANWVWGFVSGAGWLPAEEAVYLQSETLRTPMASGLAALRPGREADSTREAQGGVLLTWQDVRRLPQRPHALPIDQ